MSQDKKALLSNEEYLRIDSEIEPFRIKEGSERQKRHLEKYNVDITGLLDSDGQFAWMTSKGLMYFDPAYGYIIKADKEGKTTAWDELALKFFQYERMKRYSKLMKKKIEKEDSILPDDIPF
jgi:hypothetical protein